MLSPADQFYQAGCFFGALLTFPFAEKYGRRLTVMAASAVFLVGATLMTAANGKMNMVVAGRAVAGLGICLLYTSPSPRDS